MPWKKPWTKEITERVNFLRKEGRKKFKEQNICTSCNSRQVSAGYSKCIRCRQQDGSYYKKNRIRIIQNAKRYADNHREKVRNYRRNYLRQYRINVIEHLGGCCIKCGFHDPRALQIDHVMGDGIHEQRRLGTFNSYLHWKEVLKDKTGKYQLLCANCNWIKRAENEEHLPREKRHPKLLSPPVE